MRYVVGISTASVRCSAAGVARDDEETAMTMTFASQLEKADGPAFRFYHPKPCVRQHGTAFCGPFGDSLCGNEYAGSFGDVRSLKIP